MVGLGGHGADRPRARVAQAGAARRASFSFGATLRMRSRRGRCSTRPPDLCARTAVRCVDVEGGTVNRLRDALAPIAFGAGRGARQLAAQARQARGSLAREHGELIARAVKAFGFNTTLAPVVDLALPESAEVMGTRAAACDRGRAWSQYARAFLARACGAWRGRAAASTFRAWAAATLRLRIS